MRLLTMLLNLALAQKFFNWGVQSILLYFFCRYNYLEHILELSETQGLKKGPVNCQNGGQV